MTKLTIKEIEKKYEGKVTCVDCSFIIVSNDDWDNDLTLYIEGQDNSHAEYNRYAVVLAD